jgi:hypothetical protein
LRRLLGCRRIIDRLGPVAVLPRQPTPGASTVKTHEGDADLPALSGLELAAVEVDGLGVAQEQGFGESTWSVHVE